MAYKIDKEKYNKALYDRLLTTQDLCEKTGLAYSTIHKAVNTGAAIRPKTARLIADALNVTFDQIRMEE